MTLDYKILLFLNTFGDNIVFDLSRFQVGKL